MLLQRSLGNPWQGCQCQARLTFTWLVGAVWLVWIWLGYWLISRADLLEVVPTGVRLAALVWGITCLTYSGPLDGFIERTFPVQGALRDAIYAPLPEDGMKLLGVILIAGVVPHVLRRRMGARRAERRWLTRSTAHDLSPVTADDGRVLASRRVRRAARTAASRQAPPGGRKAARQAADAMNRRHHAQPAYLNALDTETDEQTLDQMCRQLANED